MNASSGIAGEVILRPVSPVEGPGMPRRPHRCRQRYPLSLPGYPAKPKPTMRLVQSWFLWTYSLTSHARLALRVSSVTAE